MAASIVFITAWRRGISTTTLRRFSRYGISCSVRPFSRASKSTPMWGSRVFLLRERSSIILGNRYKSGGKGAPRCGRGRTCSLGSCDRHRAFAPNSYMPLTWRAQTETGSFRCPCNPLYMLENLGRDERIRTSDPHTPSVMRYQAALRPDRRARFRRGFGKLQGFRCGLSRPMYDSLIILPPPLHLW